MTTFPDCDFQIGANVRVPDGREGYVSRVERANGVAINPARRGATLADDVIWVQFGGADDYACVHRASCVAAAAIHVREANKEGA